MSNSPIPRRANLRYWIALPVIAVVFVALCGFLLYRPSSPTALAHDQAGLAALREHWRQGDLIILVRHAERCDRSSAPCASSPEGITSRAQVEAHELGERFRALGLADADIFSSPQVRAEQTAVSMFDQAPTQQNWLYDCRGAMLRSAQQHKVPHRNLILVTHSECIEDLEATVSITNPATPAYTSSLFLISDGQRAPKLLGYLDADQWADAAPIR